MHHWNGSQGTPPPPPPPPADIRPGALVVFTGDLFKLVHFRILPLALTSIGRLLKNIRLACGRYASYRNGLLVFQPSDRKRFSTSWLKLFLPNSIEDMFLHHEWKYHKGYFSDFHTDGVFSGLNPHRILLLIQCKSIFNLFQTCLLSDKLTYADLDQFATCNTWAVGGFHTVRWQAYRNYEQYKAFS